MRAAALALGFGVAVAGCDWRAFDDLEKKTPVTSITAPSDYPASDEFGSILLGVSPPKDGSAAGRFVATALSTGSVAVVSFNAAGNASAVGVRGTAIDQLMGGPITAVAEVPGESRVVMGAPYISYGDVVTMQLDAPQTPGEKPQYPTMTFQSTVGEAQYGVGVGAGNIGGAAAAEIVVLSATTLHVYVDGLPTNHLTRPSQGDTDACPIDFSGSLQVRDRANRAVIVDQLLSSGKQIAVGSPAVTGVGHVSVFDVDVTTGTFACAAMLTGMEPRFGRAMTLVDLDGDGMDDHLLVGGPPTHAYLYTLPLSTGQAPLKMVTQAGALDFGASVAAFDVDGKPGDEMFVGDPDAAVNDVMTAGQVMVYTGDSMTPLPSTMTFPNPLAEHNPGAGHGYGSGIIGMTFCPPNVVSADGGLGGSDGGVAPCGPLPVIGSVSKVFTYFTLRQPDPRVK